MDQRHRAPGKSALKTPDMTQKNIHKLKVGRKIPRAGILRCVSSPQVNTTPHVLLRAAFVANHGFYFNLAAFHGVPWT